MQSLQLKIFVYVYVLADPVCQIPPTPVNGVIFTDIRGNDTFPFGSNITFGCSKGFVLNRTNTNTCQPNRMWTPSPTCEPIGTFCVSGFFSTLSGMTLCHLYENNHQNYYAINIRTVIQQCLLPIFKFFKT